MLKYTTLSINRYSKIERECEDIIYLTGYKSIFESC